MEFANWVLSQISGADRSAHSTVTVKDLLTLNSGTFTSPNGEIVNFIVPENMKMMFLFMMHKSQEGGESGTSGSTEL
ncbi:MAG: hypothetical protein AB2809_07390 [Candidatus Thiodiazotropha sp.]